MDLGSGQYLAYQSQSAKLQKFRESGPVNKGPRKTQGSQSHSLDGSERLVPLNFWNLLPSMSACGKSRMWKDRVVVRVRKTRIAVNRDVLNSRMTKVAGKRRTMAERAELERRLGLPMGLEWC